MISSDHRTAYLTDELARRLTSGCAKPLETNGSRPEVRWLNIDLGGGFVLARGHVGGLDVERSGGLVKDGDEDCSLFVALSNGLRFEQNDRRVVLARGDGVFIAHARAVRSWWGSDDFLLVRLPRAALGPGVRIERAGGVHLPADSETMMLIRPYLHALMRRAERGEAPSLMARRHVAELVGCVAAGGFDHADPPSLHDARLSAIRAAIDAGFADPDFCMAHAAATACISSRTGYLLCAERGLDFMAVVRGVRLDRAMERLRGTGAAGPRILDIALAVGFSDLSHFNRTFRARFGCTPSEARLL